jgi:hypothetical protein
MKDENKNDGSALFLIKEVLLGVCGAMVAGVVITLYCLPFFAAFVFVVWIIEKLY